MGESPTALSPKPRPYVVAPTPAFQIAARDKPRISSSQCEQQSLMSRELGSYKSYTLGIATLA